jgi:glucokinase
MSHGKYVIGVDLGGTNIRSAAVWPDGKIIHIERQGAGADDGYLAVVKRIAASVRAVADFMGRDPAAVGLAAPGAIDFKRNVVTRSPNFPGWADAPVSGDVAGLLGIPVLLENDANAAALGEGWMGSARGSSDFVMITLGTGVGGGVVLNGRVWRGSTGMAGEVGHIPVRFGGRKCGCGKHGCLEAYASANSVARLARERIGEPEAQSLLKVTGGDPEKIDSSLMAREAASGDRFCQDIFSGAGRDIGKAIAAIALTLDVSRFVIGGGMAEALPLMLSPMRKSAIDHAYTLNKDKLVIVKSALGGDAGMLGAAKTAIDVAFTLSVKGRGVE